MDTGYLPDILLDRCAVIQTDKNGKYQMILCHCPGIFWLIYEVICLSAGLFGLVC